MNALLRSVVIWIVSLYVAGFSLPLAPRDPLENSGARDVSLPLSVVSKPDIGVSVTPDGDAETMPENTGNYPLYFRAKILDDTIAYMTFDATCSGNGQVSDCTPQSSQVTVYNEPEPYDGTLITVYVTAADSGTAKVWLDLNEPGCSGLDCMHGSGFYIVTVEPAAPEVSVEPHNGDIITPDLCAACYDLIVTHSTPPYFSLDAPRSLTLFYSSAQVVRRGTVTVDVWHPEEFDDPPDMMSISLKNPNNGNLQTLTNGETTWFYEYVDTGVVRLAAQFYGWTPGLIHRTAVIESWWTGGRHRETHVPVRILVQDERDSDIGAGWTIAGLQELIPYGDSVIVLLDGAGGIIAFDSIGSDLFTPERGEFTKIREVADTNYVRIWDDSTKAQFTPKGDGRFKIDWIKDRFGNQTTYGYDGSGHLVRIEDPVGHVIKLSYSGGYLSSIADSVPGAARVTYVTIDASDDLTEIEDPDGRSQSFTYSPYHTMRSSTDREGNTTDYSYGLGRLKKIELPQVTLHDSSTARPRTIYSSPDERMLPHPDSTTYSTPSRRIEPAEIYGLVVGPRDDTAQAWYNSLGQPLKIVDPLGRTSETYYQVTGLPTQNVAPSGQVTNWSWSGYQLVAEEVVGLGKTWYSYEPIWGLVTTVERGSRILQRTYYYDAQGALDQVRVGYSSERIEHFPDARGQDTMVVGMSGDTTKYVYEDSWGNLELVVGPAHDSTTTVFDGYGRVTKVISPVGDTVRHEYDVLNRDTAVYAPGAANPTRTVYGPIYADTVIDPIQGVYAFERNALGWVTTRYGPADSVVSDRYGYDIAGSVKVWMNRNGREIEYTYDILGRTTELEAPDDTLTFGYDPDGEDRFAWASNAWSTDTTWYTTHGLVDRTVSVRSDTAYGVDYTYAHWSGRPTQINDEYNDRLIDFVYNGLAQLDTMRVRGQSVYVTGRDVDSLVTSRKLGPKLDVEYQRTSDHRRAAYRWLRLLFPDTVLQLQMEYDTARRVTSYARSGDVREDYHTFEYDSQSRLTRRFIWESRSDCEFSEDYGYQCSFSTLTQVDTFAFDDVGNRTDHGADVDPGNRLTEIVAHGDTVRLTYDSAGNVVRRELADSGLVQLLHWGSLGQLDSVISILGTDTTRIHYRYDAFGRRIATVVVGVSTEDYVWASGHILYDVRNDTVTEYTYLPGTDKLHTLRRDGEFYWYLIGPLGSVYGLADSIGNRLVNLYAYDPWGLAEAESEAVSNRFRYAGRELDAATGLYYFRARYYDPLTGGFLSEDPIGLQGGLNPYAYAGGNPVDLRDPGGLDMTTEDPCEEDPNSTACQQQKARREAHRAYRYYRSLIITQGWAFANAWYAGWAYGKLKEAYGKARTCAQGRGCGHFGASRKKGGRRYEHEGMDFLVDPGTLIPSPLNGTVTRIGWAAEALRYVEISNTVYRVRVMYIEPLSSLAKGSQVYLGEIIGVSQSLAPTYRASMPDHIHVEVRFNTGQGWAPINPASVLPVYYVP